MKPVLRGLQIPPAVLAPKNRGLLLQTLCDVHLGPQAIHTHVGAVGQDASPAEAAEPAGKYTSVRVLGIAYDTTADIDGQQCILEHRFYCKLHIK